MSTLAMRTHEFIKELTADGISEKAAETIARYHSNLISENLATTQDIELLRKDIELLRKELILKLGMMLIAGLVATVGIILSVLPLMLN